MRKINITLLPTKAKIATAILVTLAILAVSETVAYYQTSYTYSQASAQGSFSMVWGDPYLAPRISRGTGSESVTIIGNVAPQSKLPGYYSYTTMRLSGNLHLEWSDNADNYVLDASLSLTTYETGYDRITVNPSGDSFYVSFMDYTASITVNGLTTQKSGEAGIKAAAPGFFEQPGQARSTLIILYPPSLGEPHYVIRWSQASQIIDGLQQQAASQFTQVVTMTGSG